VEAVADEITDVDGDLTDDETEVNDDGDDNDTRENTFYSVIRKAEAGELGIDDDEKKNNKDDVGYAFDIFPNDMDG